MKMNEKVLQKIAEWRPAEQSRAVLSLTDEASGWTALVTADKNDALGTLVWELAVRRAPVPAAAAALQAWAEGMAERVTGLLEPLKVVEVDPLRREALLRSETPAERGGAVLYYEVLLRGASEASLRRYQASHEAGKPRVQVPFTLTHEALAKTAEDMAASLR